MFLCWIIKFQKIGKKLHMLRWNLLAHGLIIYKKESNSLKIGCKKNLWIVFGSQDYIFLKVIFKNKSFFNKMLLKNKTYLFC